MANVHILVNELENVTYASFHDHLQSYPLHIPAQLREVDVTRLQDIPKKLEQRKRDGKAFLEKSEVVTLVEWKLKHGTFRPKLANLVASNSEDDVISTTRSAFTICAEEDGTPKEAIVALTKLKGIGPATASLLLSCYDPAGLPFFSDPLFRYALWERTKGCGWDRKIKYNIKEYTQMFGRVQELRHRLETESGKSVSVLDLEKMAFVLSKETKSDTKRFTTAVEKEDEEEEVRPSRSGRKRKVAISQARNTDEETKQQPRPKRRKKATGYEGL